MSVIHAVAAMYQVADTRSGCPKVQAANTPTISKTITVSEKSVVMVTGHQVVKYSGRADVYLSKGTEKVDYTLTYAPSAQWKDAWLYWVGEVSAGEHEFSISGDRANAIGCGELWGDLDIVVVPQLQGVAVYQTADNTKIEGCPRPLAKGKVLLTKTISVDKQSVVVVTGHMVRLANGRADLHLVVDEATQDHTLTYTPSRQWEDGVLHWVGELKPGSHTFSMKGTVANAYGCGDEWGDLDILVLPKASLGVAGYNFPDTREGCPPTHQANTDLILGKFTVAATSVVTVTGHMVRHFAGRSDAYLHVDGDKKDYTLSYSKTKKWEDVQLHWVGQLAKGDHTVSIQSDKPNAWGCGALWGDIDVLVVPVTLDQCKTNNGGCHAKRECTNAAGGMTCGNCTAGYVNDGAKGCKGLCLLVDVVCFGVPVSATASHAHV